MVDFKNWLKRRVGYKNKPRIEIPHRVRKNGWITCECTECECNELSRWEDNLCIPCFRGMHKRKSNIEGVDP